MKLKIGLSIVVVWLGLTGAAVELCSENIELLATLPVAAQGYEVTAWGTWAFVAAGPEGVLAVDLYWPGRPVRRGVQSDIGTAVDVLVRSLDEIYVLCRNVPPTGDPGLFIYRWNGVAGRFEQRSFAALPSGQQAETLDLQHPKLNVTTRSLQGTSGLLIPVDVADPDHPDVGAGLNLRHPPLDSMKDNLLAYAAGGDKGFFVERLPGFPVPNWSNPDPRVDTPGSTNRVERSGGLCYVTDGLGGLRVMSTADPHNPAEIGFYQLPGAFVAQAKDLVLDFPTAYIAYGYRGLQVIDVTTATAMDRLAWVEPEALEYFVRAVALLPDEDLIVFLSQDGMLGVVQYPRRPPTPTPAPDVNNDGYVDYQDLFLIHANWKESYPTPTP